jgi:hydroxycarboxylate dehydrogenase B
MFYTYIGKLSMGRGRVPLFSASQLEKLGADIFRAWGAPSDIADLVSHSLVLSNLVGLDSHGVLRIPWYLKSFRNGVIEPAARPGIARETATTAVIDGNWAFGQVTAQYATSVGIEKARSSDVAAISIVRCNHTGRLGEYTEMAAREGMFAMFLNASFGGLLVTPYGGAEKVLATNPISFAVPAAEDEPMVVDFATSVTAEGKLRVARAENRPLPGGTILDRDGNPSTDANDFYDGGVMLPMAGHKGYALSVIVEMMSKFTGGAETLLKEHESHSGFMLVVNLQAFRPLEQFRAAVAERGRQIKGVRKAPGFREVLLPGEPERRAYAERLANGISLPDETLKELSVVAASYGVEMPEQASTRNAAQ